MAIIDLFSKRKKRTTGEVSAKALQYDLPEQFRNQIIHIWVDAIGTSEVVWREIHNRLARELGQIELLDLLDSRPRSLSDPTWFEICGTFVQRASRDHALDAIELTFSRLPGYQQAMRVPYRGHLPPSIRQEASEAIAELNLRFQEHSLAYRFADDRIIEIDSEYIHSEITTSALTLLHSQAFQGPIDEFMKAHTHYRHGRYKEAIGAAGDAFESTLKGICTERGWEYDEHKANASVLIGIVFDKGLIPPELRSHFSSLRSTLESGLPTVRNRRGSHGQGPESVDVPSNLAAYALHLAATNIVFLVEAHLAQRT